jgi:general secretion pathway protein B
VADAASSTGVAATALPLQALPDEVRRQLPALKVSGSIHSRRAADRLLVIDGQVAREGDSVAPDLVLERIEPRSATFRYKHHRFELAL